MPTNPERSPLGCLSGQSADLFNAMAKEVHVDLDQAAQRGSAEAMARARARCKNCSVAEECEAWLDASFGVPLPPAFCPNAPFFHLCIAAAHDKSFDPA